MVKTQCDKVKKASWFNIRVIIFSKWDLKNPSTWEFDKTLPGLVSVAKIMLVFLYLYNSYSWEQWTTKTKTKAHLFSFIFSTLQKLCYVIPVLFYSFSITFLFLLIFFLAPVKYFQVREYQVRNKRRTKISFLLHLKILFYLSF